jgi:hypothetical protein
MLVVQEGQGALFPNAHGGLELIAAVKSESPCFLSQLTRLQQLAQSGIDSLAAREEWRTVLQRDLEGSGAEITDRHVGGTPSQEFGFVVDWEAFNTSCRSQRSNDNRD